jgi:O-antigen/teichoic acid export membrane protein
VKQFKNIITIWTGALLGSGSIFILNIILARNLGSNQFGQLSSALSITGVLTLLSGSGASSYWIKIFSIQGISALRWLKVSFTLIIANIIISLSILNIWSYIGHTILL